MKRLLNLPFARPLYLLIVLATTQAVAAQDIELPEPFATPSARNSASRIDRPEGARPEVPGGFSIELYAADLAGARTMLEAPNGDVLVAQQKLDEAVAYFEKAVAQTTDEIVPYNVAEIYFNQGDAEKAIEYYQISANYKPDWADPHLKMGFAYLNTGNMEGAKASFQKVVELAPDSPQAQAAQDTLSKLP